MEPSLSQLCSICHTAIPKYTCPRCRTETCSLACAQRHKRWAQCSGERDPAEYVKQKDLATPRMFDRDFNFLTGVERAFESAGRVAEGTGVGIEEEVDDGKTGKQWVNVKGAVPFWRGVERSGVKVVRAPKGISRRRENGSEWNKKHRCIGWSIEWVLPDGSKTRSKALETADVSTAFARTEWGGQITQKSRKRDNEEESGRPNKKKKTNKETNNEVGTGAKASPQKNTEQGERRSSSQTLRPEPADQASQKEEKNQEPRIYFYLHRARSRSKVPVLIPLSESTALVDALRGRTVLEFPTLYVLHDDLVGQHEKDPRYVLEARYLAENPEEKEAGEVEDGEDHEEGEITESMLADLKALEDVDEKKILQVLQQDLGAE